MQHKRVPIKLNSQTNTQKSWGVLLSLPLIGLGFAISLQSQDSLLRCDRTAPNKIECQLTQTDLLGTLLGRERSENYLGVLQGAETIVTLNASGENAQLVLITNRGRTELVDLNHVGNPEDLATRINDFMVDQQETTLKIQQDDRWFSSAFGGILVLTGVWKILTLNKSKSQPLPFT